MRNKNCVIGSKRTLYFHQLLCILDKLGGKSKILYYFSRFPWFCYLFVYLLRVKKFSSNHCSSMYRSQPIAILKSKFYEKMVVKITPFWSSFWSSVGTTLYAHNPAKGQTWHICMLLNDTGIAVSRESSRSRCERACARSRVLQCTTRLELLRTQIVICTGPSRLFCSSFDLLCACWIVPNNFNFQASVRSVNVVGPKFCALVTELQMLWQ